MLKLRVSEKTSLTDRIAEFRLVRADGGAAPAWTPGAHIDLATKAGPRSYSLISWPSQDGDGYRIAVQREDDGDGGSAAMHRLEAGDVVEASAPSNDFELAANDRPVVLLAGGIGVTPLISMATALSAEGRPFVFHYAGRRADRMAYLPKLQIVFGDRLKAHIDDQSPIDLSAAMRRATECEIYLCGPRGMIDAARAAAETAGLSPERIHVELFATAAAASGDAAFEVEIASTGQVVEVAPGRSIIDALEAVGLDLVYDCQRGDCGICQTDVISGDPDHRDVVLSAAERASGKVMQICVSRALSKRLVLDL